MIDKAGKPLNGIPVWISCREALTRLRTVANSYPPHAPHASC